MDMNEGDRLAIKQARKYGDLLPSPLPGQMMRLHYVAIPQSAYRKHYKQISNQLLWFFQHYLYDPMQDAAFSVQDAWVDGSCVANKATADAICEAIDHESARTVLMLQD